MEIILASASPRRRELMRLICPEFTVLPAETDETLPDNVPVMERSRLLAERKADKVASEHPEALVIGADTLVVVDGLALGKPRDGAEAREMLLRLSGNVHEIVTGCALCYQGKKRSFSEVTRVYFYPLTEKEIADYIATGDPFDKAGAYGIQTQGLIFVKRIEGDFPNAVGLPAARLYREMKGMTDNA